MNRILFIFSLFVFSTLELFARAGGGGGFFQRPFRHPITYILAIVIITIAGLFIRLSIMRTRKRLARFAELDKAWDFNKLERTVEQTYFKVQNAWNLNKLEPVENLLTSKMFKKLQFQLDYYKKIDRKNVLEKIELNKVEIVSAKDYEDDSKDTFKAFISGSMIDYDLNLKTGKKIGNNWYSESFSEFWTFKRNGNNWLLDEIKD